MKRILLILLVLPLAASAVAQTNGSNSSYSRFGLGTLRDQSAGPMRAMGGVGQGLRRGNRVNMLNPASYSSIDSLTFLFDVGMSLQIGHLSQGGKSVNARNTTLDYVNAAARLARGLGLSFGFVPYSSIGYNFTREDRVGTDLSSGSTITTQNTYYGNGGLHEIYLGLGWNPFAKLSIGANIAYLWGDYNHSLQQTFYEGKTSQSAYSSLSAVYSGDVRTYKLDIGAQYPIRLGRADWLTVGATVGIGHNTHDKAELMRYTSGGDTTTVTAPRAFELPYTYSAGLAWQHRGRVIVAADYTREQWAKCVSPVSGYAPDGSITLAALTGQYLNRNRVNVGAEFIVDPESRSYGRRIQYKIGAKYASPYVKVNGQDGPKEYGVTAGLGLPISPKTVSGSRSVVNVGFEWLHRAPSQTSMITENYYMITLGITFNERWFMKWKIN